MRKQHCGAEWTGMKGWLSALMFLVVVLVVCTARAQELEPSLGDVARQNRADKEKQAESKVVVTDQVHDEPDKPAPQESLCGAPIPMMQDVYVAAFVGKSTPPEDELSKHLLAWMDAHPELKNLDPGELAKAEEPRTDGQIQAERDLANKVAQSFTEDMAEFKILHTDQEVRERLNKVMSATLPQRQADALATAVRDEKERREAAKEILVPSEKDRLEQAINLYAICENKRLISSQGEIEKLTKAALKEKLTAAGFVVEEANEGN